jgi:hypothetical protein
VNWQKSLIALSLCVVALANGNLAMAHGDEAHGDEGPVKPTPIALSASPTEAHSDAFELVAMMADNKLIIYLDDFASNAPVTGASIEVEGSGLSGMALESSDGVYSMAADAIAKMPPGSKVPLMITIEAGEHSDVLTTTLETPVTTAAEEVAAHSRAGKVFWLIAVVVGFAIVALIVIRRRQQRKGGR